ncbi:MAG: STAS domain-containing protein [SAR324 cluster bacterium]|nr:STAS domain-containing protein [SAR324 cluster bacterium]
MNLSYRIEDNICIISIAGDCIYKRTFELVVYASKLLDDFSPRALILNLSDTESMDSTGLGSISSAFKTAQKKQMGFAICHMNSLVLEMFEAISLDKIIPNYATEAEAIASLES